MKLPICAAITRDGTRCGRRAAPEGLLCHIHRAAAEGKPVGPLVEPAPLVPEEKLRKVAANDKHPQQVQALRMLLDREKCPACAARAGAEDPADRIDIWGDVTDSERARLKVLIAEFQQAYGEFKQIRSAVVARIKQGQKQ